MVTRAGASQGEGLTPAAHLTAIPLPLAARVPANAERRRSAQWRLTKFDVPSIFGTCSRQIWSAVAPQAAHIEELVGGPSHDGTLRSVSTGLLRQIETVNDGYRIRRRARSSAIRAASLRATRAS
jgi:hypothetical protein